MMRSGKPGRLMGAFGLVLLSLLTLAGAPPRAQAQTCSATVTDIDFGNPNLLSTGPSDAMGTLTVTCTRIPRLTVVKICPGIGEGSGGSSGSVRLLRTSGGRTLAYQLYQDPTRTLGWGAVSEPDLGTTPAILLGGGMATSATATRTIYGRLFGNQSVSPPGSYTSVFDGGDTSFAYAGYFLSATSTCTGFVGFSAVRPEFDIIAKPLAGCSLSSADLDFGAVGILRSAVLAQTTLRVACTQGSTYSITLDGGLTGAAPAARKMASSTGDTISYGLYRDPARTALWGDTSATRVNGAGTGSEQILPVYGLVPVQNTPRPGLYTDRVVATVTY